MGEKELLVFARELFPESLFQEFSIVALNPIVSLGTGSLQELVLVVNIRNTTRSFFMVQHHHHTVFILVVNREDYQGLLELSKNKYNIRWIKFLGYFVIKSNPHSQNVFFACSFYTQEYQLWVFKNPQIPTFFHGTTVEKFRGYLWISNVGILAENKTHVLKT